MPPLPLPQCQANPTPDGARSTDATLPRPTPSTPTVERLKTACSSCSLRELCLPIGLAREQLESLDELVYTRRRVKRGETLFRANDAFRSLYALRRGFFKTRVPAVHGRDQVTGFQMTGEILGLDGIGTERHACDAVAIEDSEVCVIPYAKLDEFAQRFPAMAHHVHKMMSREIVRDHGVMLLLGSMRAEERVAAFLLNLAQRFAARGFSAKEFNLRMTREEIGSYLGLKLETVSRTFSKFHEDGLISVQQKHIVINDAQGLRKLLGEGSS